MSLGGRFLMSYIDMLTQIYSIVRLCGFFYNSLYMHRMQILKILFGGS